MAPAKIPDHELLRCIGHGSYGEVWLARNIMGSWRAVKIVRREQFDSARPYEREFEGIQKFEPVSRTHESQLDILHVGRDDDAGYFYYVMELADDVARVRDVDPASYCPRTLYSELEESKRLPARRCLDIGIALATALEHLHSHGLIHRDVKPANVIFVNGRPKLADIGLVAGLNKTVSFVGTEGYVPPEGPGGERGDLFALGKVLYEIHTGLHRADFPNQPTALLPGDEMVLARELNLIVLKACAPEADRRQPSITALREEMEIVKTGRSVERLWRAEEERHQAVERERLLRRRLRKWGVAGVVVAGGLMLAGLSVQQHLLAERSRALAARTRDQLSQMLTLNTSELREKLEPLGKLSLLMAVDTNLARIFDPNEKEPLFLALEATFKKNQSRVLAALGRGASAIAAAEQASALLERLRTNDAADPRWTRELAETEALLAEYLSAHGEHARARVSAQSGLKRLEKVDEPLLHAWLRRGLAEAQLGLRDRRAAIVTLTNAIAEGEAILPKMGTTPDGAKLQHELALDYESLGRAQQEMGEHKLALASFGASAHLLDELVATPSVSLDRVEVQECLADALDGGGNTADALAAYRRGHERAVSLAARDPENVLWKREDAYSGAVLAKKLQIHAPDQAKLSDVLATEITDLLGDSEHKLTQLIGIDAKMEAWEWDLGGTELAFGDWYRSRKQHADALRHYLLALDLMGRFASSPETPVDRPYGLATILANLADNWSKWRDLPERPGDERALFEAWRVTAQERATVNPAWCFVSAVCEHILGENDRATGHLDAAIEAHQRGFRQIEALFRQLPPEQCPDLNFGWRESCIKLCALLAGDLIEKKRVLVARQFAAQALRSSSTSGVDAAPPKRTAYYIELEQLANAK